MKAFTSYLQELTDYVDASTYLSRKKNVGISGLVDSQKLHIIYGLSDGFHYKIIATFSEKRAKEIYEEYVFYDQNCVLFPAKDFIFFQADIHGNKLTKERILAFRKILEGKPLTIITTLDAFMAPCLPMEHLIEDQIHIKFGEELNENKLANRLVEMGYIKNYQVENPGEFSIRGGIVDVFDLTMENPYRIELWGDEIESIRSFDVLSQRSIEDLKEITIFPATEFVLTKIGRAHV